ncbi:uncharacterized protein [Lepeophtheirus salmonis]|uniref:uncharacterized protein isoform X2 n=1 Tax=Lepeophtheirus salmonis TaxID=72036 RepID=UPI001AEA8C08|nr:uncharacterized protein LOC121130596 isoform X2 [Lepeophtheirus salmonis]
MKFLFIYILLNFWWFVHIVLPLDFHDFTNTTVNTSLIKFHFDRTHHKSCSKITFNPPQGGVFEWKEVYESANVFHPIFILFLDPHAYITYVHIRFIHPCLWEDNYRDSLREGLEVFSVSHKDMEYLKRLKDFYNDQLIYKNNGSTMGLKLNKKNACSPISIEEKQTLVKPKDFVDDYVLIEKQFNCYRKVGAASALVLYFKGYTIDGANICKWNTDLIPLFERSLLQRSNCSHSWNTDLRILVLSVLFYLILL